MSELIGGLMKLTTEFLFSQFNEELNEFLMNKLLNGLMSVKMID